MTIVVRTDRVALREFNERDLDVVAELMADEEQMSLYPRPRTRKESRAWIDRNLDFYKESGFGFWLMEGVGGGDFLGYCGIRPVSIDGIEESKWVGTPRNSSGTKVSLHTPLLPVASTRSPSSISLDSLPLSTETTLLP